MLRVISIMLAIVLALLGINIGLAEVAQDSEQVIKVDASRFLFRPDVITLKKGVPVIFEFTSSDVIMGFNVPALNIRTDIIPGKVMRVRMVPEKTGTMTFLCDVFCGSGHEDMNGTITVVD